MAADPANPVKQMRRRGRRSRSTRPERIWATPWQVRRVADQAGELGGPTARLMIITAAWTGCRWGELAGLHRPQCRPGTRGDQDRQGRGRVAQARGTRWIGPPKTPWSARTIHLPPFLIALLREHLAVHPHEYVVHHPQRELVVAVHVHEPDLRPAAAGTPDRPRAVVHTVPVAPGLTFHGLRHSHKTWLIGQGDPETAQARRLGPRLDDRVVETYSHVEEEVRARLLAGLEERWRSSFSSRCEEADAACSGPADIAGAVWGAVAASGDGRGLAASSDHPADWRRAACVSRRATATGRRNQAWRAGATAAALLIIGCPVSGGPEQLQQRRAGCVERRRVMHGRSTVSCNPASVRSNRCAGFPALRR